MNLLLGVTGVALAFIFALCLSALTKGVRRK